MKYLSPVLFVALCVTSATARGITGKVVDDKGLPLVGVQVSVIFCQADTVTTFSMGGGYFKMDSGKAKACSISAFYPGYTPFQASVKTADADSFYITLHPEYKILDSVTVLSRRPFITQLGDTTEFNVDGLRKNTTDNIEDLLRKLPGMIAEGGTLKFRGEAIQQIIVDGRPFFADDPSVVLKNFPAELVAKVQVLDKKSDQAQFSGFDDGNTQKTINIVTKKRRGVIGKAYAGYGNADRYNAGVSVNRFNKSENTSIIVQTNNINQRGVNPNSIDNTASGGGQSHITSAGVNYSNDCGKKISVSGSYRYDRTENAIESRVERQYFSNDTAETRYGEDRRTKSINSSQRFGAKIEWKIDTNNTLIFEPRINYSASEGQSHTVANTFAGAAVEARTVNNRLTDHSALNFSNDLLWRHGFSRKGRTVSVWIKQQFNEADSRSVLISENERAADTSYQNQTSSNIGTGTIASASIVYTEPVTKNSQALIGYTPSVSWRETEKIVYDRGQPGNEVTMLDTGLSNENSVSVQTQAVNLGYRVSLAALTINAGVRYENSQQTSDQHFPQNFNVDSRFITLLPSFSFVYKWSKQANIRLNYSSNASLPHYTQLQNIIDNSNPLLVVAGNPLLKQEVNHNISAYYNTTGSNDRNLSINLNGQAVRNYIATAVLWPSKDTLLGNGVVLKNGSQFSYPVNIQGKYSGNVNATYSFLVAPLKGNFSLTCGIDYLRLPSFVNQYNRHSNSFTFRQYLQQNVIFGKSVDVNISYHAGYTVISGDFVESKASNYLSQNLATKTDIKWNRVVLSSMLNYNILLRDGDKQQACFINVSAGYKLLKGQVLEIRVIANNILNQQNSYQQSVTDLYVENTRNNSIRSFWMLSAFYNLRHAR